MRDFTHDEMTILIRLFRAHGWERFDRPAAVRPFTAARGVAALLSEQVERLLSDLSADRFLGLLENAPGPKGGVGFRFLRSPFPGAQPAEEHGDGVADIVTALGGDPRLSPGEEGFLSSLRRQSWDHGHWGFLSRKQRAVLDRIAAELPTRPFELEDGTDAFKDAEAFADADF